MRSKVAILGFLIVAVVGGRLWLDPIIRSRQIRKIFDIGKSERKRGAEFTSACEATTGHHKLFCRQGYAFQQALEKLNADSRSSKEVYDELMHQWLSAAPYQKNYFDEAFGLALFSAGRAVDDIKASPAWASPPSRLYILDGWQLALASAKGVPALLKECDEQREADLKEVCQFAAGRAAFLHSLRAGGRKRKAEIREGYDYYRRFTINSYKTVAQIRALSDEEDRVVQAAKYVASGEPIDDPDFKSLNSCLLTQHVTECLPQ